MIRTNSHSHAAMLERFRIALDKAESNPGIAGALEKIGYGPQVIDEGKVLLDSARKVFDSNLKKKDEQSAIRAEFAQHRKKMDSTFREHRQKALLIFKNEKSKAKLLAVSGKYPLQYDLWLETVRKFYGEIVKDPELQSRFQRLNLTKEEAEAGLTDVTKMEALYAKRMMLKGVSQNSTEQKDKAFAKINEWMSDFFAVARLALKREPELLEALFKTA